MIRTQQQDERFGVISGLSAYFMWGALPLYWPLLQPADAFEILGHRIIWSLIFLLLLMQLTNSWQSVWSTLKDLKLLLLVIIASFLVASNWGIYIWAVNANHVVETSLGYFINPLVIVLLGVVFFGEKLRKMQKIAVAIAFFAVLILTYDYGRLPWIALGLTFTFGVYGALKKKINLPAIAGLFMETAIMIPFTVGYLFWLSQNSSAIILSNNSLLTLAIISGPLTALPLLLFGSAATRVPMTWIGVMQYIAPTIQFIIGVWVFGEQLSMVRVIGFIAVWTALIVFTVDAWRASQARQNAQ